MKFQITLFTAFAAVALIVTGCSKQSVEKSEQSIEKAADDAKAVVVSVDTSNLEKAFAAADADTKKALEPVIAAVKKADFAGAVTQLKSLGEKFKLTDEQQAAVNDLIAKAQKAISDLGTAATGDATKAATDISKTLGK